MQGFWVQGFWVQATFLHPPPAQRERRLTTQVCLAGRQWKLERSQPCPGAPWCSKMEGGGAQKGQLAWRLSTCCSSADVCWAACRCAACSPATSSLRRCNHACITAQCAGPSPSGNGSLGEVIVSRLLGAVHSATFMVCHSMGCKFEQRELNLLAGESTVPLALLRRS